MKSGARHLTPANASASFRADMPSLSFSRLLLLLPALGAVAALAQPGQPSAPGDQAWTLTAAGVWRAGADLDAGGDVSSRDYRLELGTRRGLAGNRSIGASLSYQLLDYDFSARPGAPASWDSVEQIDLGLSYSHPLDRTSSLFAAPSLGLSAESGAADGDSLRYGGIFGYSRQIDSRLTLGAGAGVFLGLEDSSVFPVVFVRWQLNDTWRLGNPFRPGPAGPAGIELVYTGLEAWELGFGASYRSQRFKLETTGAGSPVYGEDKGVAVFLRATRDVGSDARFDLFLGTVAGGELSWDDASGHRLARTDYDPSLLAALAFTADF